MAIGQGHLGRNAYWPFSPMGKGITEVGLRVHDAGETIAQFILASQRVKLACRLGPVIVLWFTFDTSGHIILYAVLGSDQVHAGANVIPQGFVSLIGHVQFLRLRWERVSITDHGVNVKVLWFDLDVRREFIPVHVPPAFVCYAKVNLRLLAILLDHLSGCQSGNIRGDPWTGNVWDGCH